MRNDHKRVARIIYHQAINVRGLAFIARHQTLKGHSGLVWSVAFSHDDKRLALASDDCTMKVWDTASGNCFQTLEGHSGWVRSVAFSHNDKRLASALHDCTMKVWDTALSNCLQTLEPILH